MDLAAKLHPHLLQSQDQDATTVRPTKNTKRSRRALKQWTDAERHALWRSINTWCKEHGVDKFALDNFDTGTWKLFADRIKAEYAGQASWSIAVPSYNERSDCASW